jgi:hypothetical protein
MKEQELTGWGQERKREEALKTQAKQKLGVLKRQAYIKDDEQLLVIFDWIEQAGLVLPL